MTASPAEADRATPLSTFSSPKQRILRILKREGEADLQGLSDALGVTRMAVYKHVRDLEARGFLARHDRREGVGRPRMVLTLASDAQDLFPRAYADLTCHALRFIERRLGREAVERALQERYMEVLREYEPRVRGDTLEARVEALARLRDEDGYMAEARAVPGGGYEILEYNCPILAVAQEYSEACGVERGLFQRVLGADVETTHRTVAGDSVCRFLIRPRHRSWE